MVRLLKKIWRKYTTTPPILVKHFSIYFEIFFENAYYRAFQEIAILSNLQKFSKKCL